MSQQVSLRIPVARPKPPIETFAERPALHLLTCGSVDDGKSTLIGRLLYERNLVLDDQLATLERK